MFVLIVGIGRVGSSLARTMLDEGHEVSCLDEDPDALALLEAVMGGATGSPRAAASLSARASSSTR